MITERRLRRIIRQVIRESLERDVLSEGWREKTAAALSGLAIFMGSLGGASAKPISKHRASSVAERMVEKEIGSLNMPLKNMVAEVLSSVDENHIHIIEKEVLNPWLNAVRDAKSNPEYYDSVRGDFKPFVYKVLRNLLSDKIDEFIKKKRYNKRSQSSASNPGYTESIQSSLTKAQQDDYNKKRSNMQKALRR
tara:strand:+ start:153 stop:734 length:582 start_codon:yes stop_codon:yes gene_type:complete